MTESRSIAVALDDVAVTYEVHTDGGVWAPVHALAGVTLHVAHGEAIGLVGHNGSGKSTLLQVVAGFLEPTAGTVRVAARPRLLGIRAALNPRLSGRRNILLGCLALGLSPPEARSVEQEIVDFTELGDFVEVPVNTYSAGMTARLAFGIASVARPEILLIDEALSVGDYHFKQKCLNKLAQVRDSAGVVIMASHSMSEIEKTCDRALWLHNGRPMLDGDPNEVVSAYLNSKEPIDRDLDL